MPVPDGEDIFMAECITSIQGNGTAVQLGGVGSAQCVQKYLREINDAFKVQVFRIRIH